MAVIRETGGTHCHLSAWDGGQEGGRQRNIPSQNTNQIKQAGGQARECRLLPASPTLLKRWEQEENCGISVEDSSSLVSSSSEPKCR